MALLCTLYFLCFLIILTISVAKFPDHFYQLSGDDNRGFTQEYEVHKKDR